MQILLLFAIALPVIGALAWVAGWVLGAAFGVLLSPFVFALTLWRMLARP